MCHTSEYDHYFEGLSIYKTAEPGQTRRHCTTPSEAKFWREAQDRPTDWIIMPGGRGAGYVVVKIGNVQ